MSFRDATVLSEIYRPKSMFKVSSNNA